MTNQTHKFTAIEVVTNTDAKLFISAIPVAVLTKVCHVSRADEDPKKGFQRLLSDTRLKAIADYLENGKIIPGSLILSAHQDSQVRFDKKTGKLSFIDHPKGFFVIDGQHRLYGANKATVKTTFAVSILTGLTLEEEVQYFNDINGEQKGVPRTLQLEIEKFLVPDESKEKIRINIFHALNQRPDSPLCNRMSATKSVQGKLSHVPFKAAIEPLLDQKPLNEMDFESKVNLLINFLKGVEDVLIKSIGSSDKLTNAAFFQALFGAFKPIAMLTQERSHDYKDDSFGRTLKPLANIEWDKHNGTNRQSIQSLTRHIADLVW